MVYTDATVDLIMQADFPIRFVLSTADLNAVHAQVGVEQTWLLYVFAVDLSQRDKSASVVRPRFEVREGAEFCLVLQDRTATPSLCAALRQAQLLCARPSCFAPGPAALRQAQLLCAKPSCFALGPAALR